MPGLLIQTPDADAADRAVAHDAPWLDLLGRVYARHGLPRPGVTRLTASQVSPPYGRLLVHSDDMTPTLERFYGERLRLQVLSRECAAERYQREVVLDLELRRRTVEYGAISIHLRHLTPRARQLVLAEEQPFGRILQSEAIAHLSWPQAFFTLKADAHLSGLLGAVEAAPLYGRRNVLLDGHRRLLAEVIEIVAPVSGFPSVSYEHPAS
jgi:hypothetical protein